MNPSRTTLIGTNPGWRAALYAVVALAATCISNGALATPVFTSIAGNTAEQGAACASGGDVSNGFPSFLPNTAFFSCINAFGNGFPSAHSGGGSVGAFAAALSVAGNKGSAMQECVIANATYSDASGRFLPITAGGVVNSNTSVTLNVNFHAKEDSHLATANVVAMATINGQVAATCGVILGTPECVSNPISVPLNQIVSTTLSITAHASAGANGQLDNATATANGSDTFSFAISGAVFNLPDGITFEDPDASIFDNVYSPASSETPLPASLPLFVGGLGVPGFGAYCRKRKLVSA